MARVATPIIVFTGTLIVGVPTLAADFADPVRIQAGGEFVKVESPGFAAPTWVDFNNDGLGDIVVGQFADGKMKVFRGTEGGFATGEWIMAEGEVAEVPGVW